MLSLDSLISNVPWFGWLSWGSFSVTSVVVISDIDHSLLIPPAIYNFEALMATESHNIHFRHCPTAALVNTTVLGAALVHLPTPNRSHE